MSNSSQRREIGIIFLLILLLLPVSCSLHQHKQFKEGNEGSSRTDAREMWNAINSDDLVSFRAILEKHPDLVNHNFGNGETPLHIAAMMGKTKAAELLIQHKANVNEKASQNATPLHMAASARIKDKTIDVVILLIKNGADVNAKNDTGDTPLHIAAIHGHVKTAEILIQSGAKIEEKSFKGHTPLFTAINEGKDDCVGTIKLLIENGADVNIKDEKGHSLIEFALQKQRYKVVELLIASHRVKADNIFNAAMTGDISKIRSYISKTPELVIAKDSADITPLHWAASFSDFKTVEFLLSKGADVNAETSGKRTPLHCASRAGKSDMAGLFLSKGADVNARDCMNQTPLHCATEQSDQKTIKILISKGADVNAKSTITPFPLKAQISGWTPLHYAAARGQYEIVEMLINAGADLNIKDDYRQTPLYYAERKGIFDVFYSYSETTFEEDSKRNTDYQKTIDILQEHGAKDQ